MAELNEEIGLRLKEVRERFIVPGIKLSAYQFASMTDSTSDKISNYERGISSVPNSLLVTLYHLGINPLFILTCEKDVYADNEAGRLLSGRFKSISSKMNIEIIKAAPKTDQSKSYPVYKAAAGDLSKARKEKK